MLKHYVRISCHNKDRFTVEAVENSLYLRKFGQSSRKDRKGPLGLLMLIPVTVDAVIVYFPETQTRNLGF